MNPDDSIDNLTALGMLMRLADAAAAYLLVLDCAFIGTFSSAGFSSEYLVLLLDLNLTTGWFLELDALLALLRMGVGARSSSGAGELDRLETLNCAPGEGVIDRRLTLCR